MICCSRELHKEVVAGIDEAMARHAQETDKVDLLTLKKLKARVNALEQQIVADKAKQLTVMHWYKQPDLILHLHLHVQSPCHPRSIHDCQLHLSWAQLIFSSCLWPLEEAYLLLPVQAWTVLCGWRLYCHKPHTCNHRLLSDAFNFKGTALMS